MYTSSAVFVINCVGWVHDGSNMKEEEKSDDGDERERTELLFLKAVILPSYHPFVNNVHNAHNTTKTENMKWKATKYYI